MRERSIETTREPPERDDLDDYASYEEGDDLVICERTNPKAWVKSDTTVSLSL